MQPHFYLKNRESDTPTLISLYFRYNGSRIVISTGMKTLPKHWNFAKERLYAAHKNSTIYNRELSRLTREIPSIYYRLLDQKGATLTLEALKHEFKKAMGRGKIDDNVLEFIEALIREREYSFSKATIKVYRSTLNHLKGYLRKRRINLVWSAIDYKFMIGFEQYLMRQPIRAEAKEVLGDNTIHKALSTFKAFVNEARKQGETEIDLSSFKPQVKQRTASEIYLNKNELRQFYYHDFGQAKRYERARDLLIVAAYTGLRFSDFMQLSKENLRIKRGKEIFEVITQKTGRKVNIPVHPWVKAVLEKYDWQLPSISNQKLNKYLKEAGKLAGIDAKFTKEIVRAGKTYSKTYCKYELIKSHTGRRSFATNTYLDKIPAYSIMEITGHKTEAAFLRYLKLDSEENAIDLAAHKFFTMEEPLRIVKDTA